MRGIALAASLALASGRLFAQHDMSSMSHASYSSGTSWLPDSTRVHGIMHMSGDWMLSLHGSISGVYDNQRTQRGDTQVGVIDWEMLMAARRVGAGELQLRAMTSLEPFILGGSGYAELLQTGGSYRHAFLHDRQHPHDALVEVAAIYSAPAWHVYAAAVGEPAAGPVAYMHRPSAEWDVFAPLGHHWQDASHQSFGVLTAGVHSRALQLEGSVFNAREPDEGHLIVDYRGAALDSYSGRLSWRAAPTFVASTWWAYLGSHDRLDPDTRMHRYGASMMQVLPLDADRQWATTLIWGMNVHHHSGASHLLLHGGPNASPHHHASSLLAETSVDVTRGTALFARVERVMKNGEELGFLGGDLTESYEVRALSVGGTRRLSELASRDVRAGVRGSINFVPEELRATYGTRTPSGLAVYLQLH